jgi:predicted NAD/FAD-dependent oxidoreductase
MDHPSHLAVIGAGIAGLSCAGVLQQAGIKVSLFDKSKGPAGRMSTRRANGWQCDHGAQYFTAQHPDFRKEVARWKNAGVADLWNPRLQVLVSQDLPHQDQGRERFVGVPRMTAPAHFLCSTLALTTRTTIQQISLQADGCYLRAAENGWLDTRFDAVLLALPAPQAAMLLQEPAPGLATVANSAKMRSCWCLMARFDSALTLPFDAAFVNSGPLRWVARDNSKPGRSGQETWVLHATADWSDAHLENDADNVADSLLEAFRQLGAPEPVAWTAHRWRYASTAPQRGGGCVWDADTAVGLCGDWINGGTVEGAWLSGRQLGGQVLQSFRNRLTARIPANGDAASIPQD